MGGVPWLSLWSAISKMPSRLDCSAVRGRMVAAWKRKYEIFFAAPQLKKVLLLAGWVKKSLLYSLRPGSKPIFPSCAAIRLSPSILRHDHSGYERAFGGNAPDARPERYRLAR